MWANTIWQITDSLSIQLPINLNQNKKEMADQNFPFYPKHSSSFWSFLWFDALLLCRSSESFERPHGAYLSAQLSFWMCFALLAISVPYAFVVLLACLLSENYSNPTVSYIYIKSWITWQPVYQLTQTPEIIFVKTLPSRHLLVYSQQWKHQNDKWNQLKVNN